MKHCIIKENVKDLTPESCSSSLHSGSGMLTPRAIKLRSLLSKTKVKLDHRLFILGKY